MQAIPEDLKINPKHNDLDNYVQVTWIACIFNVYNGDSPSITTSTQGRLFKII